MRILRYAVVTAILAFALATGALASSVPNDLVVESLNGQQRIVKTYVLPPDADPEALEGEPFDYEGYHYTWAYTTKEEKTYREEKEVTQTVTVETKSKNLSDVLAALEPTIEYDDGEFKGVLALDHTTIKTEVSGYTTKSATATATKTIENLDSNDMSYIPATTVKDGRTLTLKNVEWHVTGTDLVGDTLMPCTYQAVASYSAKYSYKSANGYVSTAEYKGKVVAEGVESIIYTVVYAGEEIVPPESNPEPDRDPEALPGQAQETDPDPAPPTTTDTDPIKGSDRDDVPRKNSGDRLLPVGIVAAGSLLVGLGGFLYYKKRKNVYIYIPDEDEGDYRLIDKFRVDKKIRRINLKNTDPYPTDIVAIELKRSAVKALAGKKLKIICNAGVYYYKVPTDVSEDWHTFHIEALQPNT